MSQENRMSSCQQTTKKLSLLSMAESSRQSFTFGTNMHAIKDASLQISRFVVSDADHVNYTRA